MKAAILTEKKQIATGVNNEKVHEQWKLPVLV